MFNFGQQPEMSFDDLFDEKDHYEFLEDEYTDWWDRISPPKQEEYRG